MDCQDVEKFYPYAKPDRLQVEENQQGYEQIQGYNIACDAWESYHKQEIDKLRLNEKILINELKELISLCENAGDFSNGNTFSGMDEGIVNAGMIVANSRNAINKIISSHQT